jgi:hypothetical protein
MLVSRVAVEFDIYTQGVDWENRPPGVGFSSPGAWTENDTYFSLARYPEGGPTWVAGPDARLEVWRSNAEDWEVFHPRILPPETKLHLARRAAYGGLEAIISHVTSEGREVLERVRGGNAAPLVIAEGPFRNVVASPDRTRLFGTFDMNGRFARAPGETFPEGEAFWLSHLKGMDGVEKFYSLDEAKYLLLKY